jgi:6-phosphogluconolactonase (cycloisomerase 2 family)
MNRTPRLFATRLGSAAAAAVALSTLASPAFAGAPTAQPDRFAGAVFVESDNVDGNTVVAYTRQPDGSLVQAGVYDTGGLGGSLDGAVVDRTASQGSLTIDRQNNLLYAVNAGSDTITVFAVHRDRLTRLQVVPSGGDFPVSITVHGSYVYVLNARAGGSVQGFVRHGHRLAAVPAWHRDLGLDTSATPEFTHTPGQILFTPSGTKLLVSTKASATIEVFRVDAYGGVSRDAVTYEDTGAVPFGMTFDPAGHLVVAEAGVNAVTTFTVNGNGTLTLIERSGTGQAATCWIAGSGKLLYASNAGSASVSGFSAARTGTLTALGNTTTDAGTVDAAASPDGRFLYVQAGAAGIVDSYRIERSGSLTPVGAVTVPGAVGGEGIATT